MSGTIPAELESLDRTPAILTKGKTLPVTFTDAEAQAATLKKGATLPVEFAPTEAVPAILARTVIDGTPGAPGADGANGQGFNNRGAWVSGNDYAAYDVLTDGGQTFLCTTAITGSTSAPASDATHFLLWAQKGADGVGSSGPDFISPTLCGGAL